MDFGKVNTPSLSSPASAMEIDKDVRLTGTNKTIYLGGTTGTTSEAIRGNSGYIEIKNANGEYSHLNTNYTAGMVTTPTTSVTSAGVLTVSAFTVNLHTDVYGTSIVETFSVSGGTVTIDENIITYVCVNYNGGTPVVQIFTDECLITGTTVIPFLNCFRQGTATDILAWGESSKALAIKLSSKDLRINRIQREVGLAISNPSDRLINITEGHAWFGSTRVTVNSFTTGASGCTLREWVHDGSMDWTATIVPTFDTANYQGTSGKADLANNEFGCIWIFRKIVTTESTGKEVAGYIFGTAAYASKAEADASPLPADLPPIFTAIGLLVGKIVFNSDDLTALSVFSAFTTHFSVVPATNHNNLSDLQGGAVDAYYHSTLNEYTHEQSLPYTAIYNQLYNTGFERWTMSGLTQGAASGRQTAFNVANIFTDTDGSTYAGWQVTGCTVTDGGTTLLITQSGANTVQYAKYVLAGLTVGKRYKFATTVANGTQALGYGFGLTVETSGGTHIRSTRTETAGTYSILWEAVGTTDVIVFKTALTTGSGNTIAASNVYVDEVTHGCVDADAYAACDHSKTTTLDCFRYWNATSANVYGYGKYLLKTVKGADSAEYYNFDNINIDYRSVQTRNVAFGCYVYSVTSSTNAKLSIYDGNSEIALSTGYCPANTKTWMEVTGVVSATATKVQPRVLLDGATNDVAYISHPVLLMGKKIGEGNYRIGPSLTLPHGQFSSSETQALSSTSLTFPVRFNTDDVKQAIVHSTTVENSKFKMVTAGTYLFTISAIGDVTGNGDRIHIWVAIDGVNVANSNTIIQQAAANNESIIAMSWIYTFTENQYVELIAYSDGTGSRFVTTAANSGPPARPASPSIIVTINMV